MIEREIATLRPRNLLSILRSLTYHDSGLVNKLYEASQAGVKIRAVIRGMCTLKPGIEGLSENILYHLYCRQILRHHACYGLPQWRVKNLHLFCWLMTRNLDYRIWGRSSDLRSKVAERIKGILEIPGKW